MADVRAVVVLRVDSGRVASVRAVAVLRVDSGCVDSVRAVVLLRVDSGRVVAGRVGSVRLASGRDSVDLVVAGRLDHHENHDGF